MNRLPLALAIVALSVIGHSAMAAQLLGLPFGEKLALAQCPFNAAKAKAPCWIGQPFLYTPTGAKLGYIHAPNADSRPAWAAYGMFHVTLDRDGNVQVVRVEPVGQDLREEIIKSVSSRFGKAVENDRFSSGLSSARWKSAEGSAQMHCTPEKCTIEFRTPKAQAEYEAEMAERERVERSRPKSP